MIIKTSDPEFRQIDAACRRSATDWWRTGCAGSFSTWLHKEWGIDISDTNNIKIDNPELLTFFLIKYAA
jgi:hypothetical protein